MKNIHQHNLGSFGVGIKKLKQNIRRAGISDEVFGIKMIMALVAFRIMWARELLKNALEATAEYLKTEKGLKLKLPAPIKVRVLPVDGLNDVRYTGQKISILNYLGMSFQKLLEIPNIFCKGGKLRDFLKNFGVGVKITCTKFSDVLFISKKDDLVHFTRIGLNEDEELVIFEEPKDCTEWAWNESEARGYDMEHDWTEVILVGKEEDQNTLTHTFSPSVEEKSKLHMLQNLFRRFWEIPANIEITFEDGSSTETTPHNSGTKSGGVIFKTINDIWNNSLKANPNNGAFQVDIYDPQSGHTLIARYDAPRKNFGEEFWRRFQKEKTITDQNNWLAKNGLKLLQDPMPSEDIVKQLVLDSKYVKEGMAQPTSSYSANRVLGNNNNSANLSCLVWGEPGEQEMYAITENSAWKSIASKLGIYSDYIYFKMYLILNKAKFKPNLDRSCLVDENTDVVNQAVGNVDSAYKFKDFVDVIQRCLQDPKAKDFMDMVDKHNKQNVSADCDEIMDAMIKNIDFTPYQEEQDKEVDDPSSKGNEDGDGDDDSNYKKPMPKNINFTNIKLTCPKCRKEKPSVRTFMPRGTKVCPRCGYKRPEPKDSGIDTKIVKLKLATPKPKFVNEESLNDFWARSEQASETSDIIFVNPKHDAVKRLLKQLEKEKPDVNNLPQEDRDQIANDAFEVLKASTGVQYMTAKSEMQNSGHYFDHRAWESFTDKAQYTYRARFDNLALRFLISAYTEKYQPKAKSVAK